jgi:hypothetical protein
MTEAIHHRGIRFALSTPDSNKSRTLKHIR